MHTKISNSHLPSAKRIQYENYDLFEHKLLIDELQDTKSKYSKLSKEFITIRKNSRNIIDRLMLKQEEEKKMISRELHDEVAQLLTGVNFKLAILRRDVSCRQESVRKKIADTQKLVEHSVDVIHKFAKDLRPPTLAEIGFICALKDFIKQFTNNSKIKVTYKVTPQVDMMDTHKRCTLFRVAQEAFFNIGKHSHATQASLTILKRNNEIYMTIKDNGVSFNVDKAMSVMSNKRLGLVGMQERINAVNGKLFIESSKGEGTILKVRLPFDGRH